MSQFKNGTDYIGSELLHTPGGVRDTYGVECENKLDVAGKVHDVMKSYGFDDIQTPTFEYFDIFSKERGTASSKEMFKFFDRNNNTLVLRPDMTPSIARSVAKYYSACEFPLRLSYRGNTFLNNRSYQGKLTEKTEMGAELINDDSPEADAEGIIMMIDCFLAAGLTDFRIDIGQAEFYKGIMDALEASEEVKEQIHEYIENKNALGMEILLSDLSMKDCYRNILLEYNDLYGDVTMLEKAKKLTINPRCQAAIARLEEVYEVLKLYGYEKYVSFDLGMVNHFDYYTGIIFRGYTYGTGDAIGKGGRYDNLLAQFGKEASASGFTILIDDVLSALSRQNISISLKEYAYSLLLYKSEDRQNAIPLVVKLRDAGVRTELVSMTEGKTLEEYLAFGKNQGAEGILYLDGENVTVYDMASGDQETKTLQEFREEY